ncbi:hypothetical protein HK104_003024 [Borealophlyctis nickersoniae]|nr:hypothetical protein HK104_003024 [Borealophlyctis nickersoniae]
MDDDSDADRLQYENELYKDDASSAGDESGLEEVIEAQVNFNHGMFRFGPSSPPPGIFEPGPISTPKPYYQNKDKTVSDEEDNVQKDASVKVSGSTDLVAEGSDDSDASEDDDDDANEATPKKSNGINEVTPRKSTDVFPGQSLRSARLVLTPTESPSTPTTPLAEYEDLNAYNNRKPHGGKQRTAYRYFHATDDFCEFCKQGGHVFDKCPKVRRGTISFAGSEK